MAPRIFHDRPEGPRFEEARQRRIGINDRCAVPSGGQRQQQEWNQPIDE